MCGRLQFCKGKFGFILICGMRSCVRPVAAGVIAAGLDEVRFPGSNQSIGLVVLTAPRSAPVTVPGRSSSITFALTV